MEWLKRRARAVARGIGELKSRWGKSIRDNWWWLSTLFAGFAVFAIVSVALAFFFPVGIIALASIPAFHFLGGLTIGAASLVVGALAFGFTQIVGILVHGGAAGYNAFDRWVKGKKKPIEQFQENEKNNINILRKLIGEDAFKEHVKKHGDKCLSTRELKKIIEEQKNVNIPAEGFSSSKRKKWGGCCGIFGDTKTDPEYYNDDYVNNSLKVN